MGRRDKINWLTCFAAAKPIAEQVKEICDYRLSGSSQFELEAGKIRISLTLLSSIDRLMCIKIVLDLKQNIPTVLGGFL